MPLNAQGYTCNVLKPILKKKWSRSRCTFSVACSKSDSAISSMLKMLRHRCFYSHWKIIVDWKGNFEFQFTVAVKQRKVIPNENKEGQEWETQINADCRWRALRFFSKIFQMCDILPWVISLAFYPSYERGKFLI